MKRTSTWLAAVLFATPLASVACDQQVVLSEHLRVDDPGAYYLVRIQRAHGENLVGTIERAFGAGLRPGRTASIQFVQEGLADAVCALEFTAGQTWLLNARVAGGALQVSRFNSHNIPSDHERFAAYVGDVEAASAGR